MDRKQTAAAARKSSSRPQRGIPAIQSSAMCRTSPTIALAIFIAPLPERGRDPGEIEQWIIIKMGAKPRTSD